jgi:hypothetical protein
LPCKSVCVWGCFFFYDERSFPLWLEFASGLCSAGSNENEVPLFELLGVIALSLQAFVVAWYLLSASRALAWSPSRRSFVVDSSVSGVALGFVRGEPCLSLCGIIPYVLYIRLNGVNPAARDSVMLSAHLPFLSSNSLFYCGEDFTVCALYNPVRLWVVD